MTLWGLQFQNGVWATFTKRTSTENLRKAFNLKICVNRDVSRLSNIHIIFTTLEKKPLYPHCQVGVMTQACVAAALLCSG